MKAYPRCPGCGRRNISPNAENKHHYAVLCTECNKLYYQTAKDLNTNAEDDNETVLNKPEELEPLLLDPVPYNDKPIPYPFELQKPDKPVTKTTLQARINSD